MKYLALIEMKISFVSKTNQQNSSTILLDYNYKKINLHFRAHKS